MDTWDTCNCCGGKLPAPMGSRELDDLDRYLTRPDGMCTGVATADGCGAWSAEAYAAARNAKNERP